MKGELADVSVVYENDVRMMWDAFETDESQWLIVNSYIHVMLVWAKIVLFWHFDGMIPILRSWSKPFQVII